MQYAGPGDGRDGIIPVSGVINTYSFMTATGGTKTVNTNLTVSAGDMVLLIITRGSGAGTWEVVIVNTPGAGSFTTTTALDNSYLTGSPQAVRVPQYSGGNISGTITGTAWDGTIGSLVAFAASGHIEVISGGVIDLRLLGFRGGNGTGNSSGGASNASAGEGSAGASLVQTAANGNGGGGGGGTSDAGPGGGGGANLTGGNPGAANQAGGTFGAAGVLTSTIDNVTITPGGGGGGGKGESNNNQGGTGKEGGRGAGMLFTFVNSFRVAVGGSVLFTGQNGVAAAAGPAMQEGAGGGGGGAGGSWIHKGVYFDNQGTVDFSPGSGGSGNGTLGGNGGAGGYGSGRIEACTIDGSVFSPTGSYVEGGMSYCVSGGFIY